MEWLPGEQHKMFARIDELREFVMKKIQEHLDTLDPTSPRDYIDCFLMRLDQVWPLITDMLRLLIHMYIDSSANTEPSTPAVPNLFCATDQFRVKQYFQGNIYRNIY